MNRLFGFFSGVRRMAVRIFVYGKAHKVQAVVALLVLAGLGYWGYTTYAKNVITTQYVLAPARTAPIEETVTGSGQVASEHQLNLSPKASGTLTSVSVKAGQEVVAGQVIASVDSTDAQKSLRDAAANLEGARITYLQSTASNSNSSEKSRRAVFSTSASVYADIGTTLENIDAVMNGNEVSGSYAIKNIYAYTQTFNNNAELVTLRDRLLKDYERAENLYETSLQDYNRTTQSSDAGVAAGVAGQTYLTAQATAQVAKDLNDFLAAVKAIYGSSDVPSVLTAQLSSSLSYLTTANASVSSSLTAKNDIDTVIQSSGSNGSVSLSQASAQLAYQKAQNAYQDAQADLADYVVRAPFAGTIAQVPLQKYDQAGSGTTVAVLVTKQQIATLSLNEVDAAKVRSGQKAILTFDAFDDLTIDGTVAEVDTVGTVSQGVVTYTVKIGFDSDDDRILPGMTVNATIVTASKEDALVIPSSAIKTQGTQTYVEVTSFAGPMRTGMATSSRQGPERTGTSTVRMFGAGTGGPTVDAASVTTRRVTVTTGLTSDTMTEVTSGLTAGEFVVSQSLNASGKSTGQSPSIFNLFGGPRTGTQRGAAGGNATFRAGAGGPPPGATVAVPAR